MFVDVPTRRAAIAYYDGDKKEDSFMADVSVYYFLRRSGIGGKELLSKRRATLETIKDRGAAVMRSQRVVDHTEVDGNGFSLGRPKRPQADASVRLHELL